MTYSSASDVAQLTKNLLGPEATYTLTSSPTVTAVNSWLTSGCSELELFVVSLGYDVPIPVGSIARAKFEHLEALYAAAWAEFSRTTGTLVPDERTRGQVLMEMFYDQLDRVSDMDLSRAGVSRSSAGKMHVGGISIARKQTVQQNTDNVQPRFFKDMFSFPGTLDPMPSTASSR